MALSVLTPLVGGGVFPPLIGLVGGAAGTRINAPLRGQRVGRPCGVSHFLAGLWPWPLVAFSLWLVAQYVVGSFFNELVMASGFVVLIAIVGLLVLSVASARAYDIRRRERSVVTCSAAAAADGARRKRLL